MRGWGFGASVLLLAQFCDEEERSSPVPLGGVNQTGFPGFTGLAVAV